MWRARDDLLKNDTYVEEAKEKIRESMNGMEDDWNARQR